MRRREVLAAAALLLVPLQGNAQRAVVVRADNDAFNFWQAPWARPDEEYTSGVRLVLDFDGRLPLPFRRTRVDPCGAARGACVEQSYSFGQDIFTAARHRGDTTVRAGARPDAGLLWLSVAERVTRAGRVGETRVTLGITGRPSMAAQMQHFFHGLAPEWNRPTDWSRQLPAELTFGVSHEQRRPRLHGAVLLEPYAGASLGTLLTELRGGVAASWAVHRHVSLVGDATAHAVARSEVLSGTFFRPSDRVPVRPFVTEFQFGARGTWRRLSVAWIAHQTGAEYIGRQNGHSWSSLSAEWRR